MVVVVHPTCNMFDAYLEDLWKKHVEHFFGPIIGHSSDGDSRKRMFMLKDYYSTTCMIYQIPWEGWRLTGLYDGFKVTSFHEKNYIHNGKNLVNPLFSGQQDLIVGQELISFNQVIMVYSNFKVDDHTLKIEDIERIDRQNWGLAQRIASRHV